MKRALILGGGFGGLSAAHHLRSAVPDAEIVLIDRRDEFAMGFHKVSWVVGREDPGTGTRSLGALGDKGVRFVNAPIDSIDPSGRGAVAGGETFDADVMLIALGADINHDAVPGLAGNGVCFYCREHALKAGKAFAALAEGRVVVGIFGAPYKCQPAPFELAILAHDAAAAAKRNISLTVFSPLPMSLPVLGAAGCAQFEGQLAWLGIDFRPEAKAERVETDRVVLQGGDEIPFDLLLAVPPHRCPPVAADAGLTGPSGWIKTDPRTLQTGFDGVWAVGDATGIPIAGGGALPKAGAIAEEEGRVAALRMAAVLTGTEPEATFTGEGACYLESGGGEAMLVRGNFYADPPAVELTAPSREALAQKEQWERERLTAWLGTAP